MNRQEKSLVVESLKHSFQDSQAQFLVGCKGLTVEQSTRLRRQLREQGGAFKVAKITLMKRMLSELPEYQGIDDHLKDQVGLVFAHQDSPAIAKVLAEFAKENEQLNIIAGFLDAKLLDKNSITALASLPSREVLLAQLAGTLQAPISGLARALNMMIIKLVLALKQVQEKKS